MDSETLYFENFLFLKFQMLSILAIMVSLFVDGINILSTKESTRER